MGTDLERQTPQAVTVSGRARQLIERSLAPSTQAAYQSDMAAWASEGVSIPADPAAILEALTRWHHDSGLAPSTLTRRAAALSTAHRLKGYPSPCQEPAVRHLLRGIRGDAAEEAESRGRGKAEAVKAGTLRAMLPEPVPASLPLSVDAKGNARRDRAAQTQALRDARDRALLLLGFSAALRRSEIVALNVGDITRDGYSGLIVNVRRSKTDQEGKGANIGIPSGGLGAMTAEALDAWLALSGISSGPLFRPIDRHGNVRPSRLTPESANRIVQDRATMAGLDAEGISAHSLRSGYITTQAQRKVPEYQIQRVSRHASVKVLRDYIRDATIWDDTPDLQV